MTERMTWDHTADHELLSAMVSVLQPSQDQLRSVVDIMHSRGYMCTLKAITYLLTADPASLSLTSQPFFLRFSYS
jgi:uncharacterized protein (UPF0297 family)